MALLTRVDAATEERIRASIAGKPVRYEAKARKVSKRERVKTLTTEFHRYEPDVHAYVFQWAIAFDSAFYNTSRVSWAVKHAEVKRVQRKIWNTLNRVFWTIRGSKAAAERQRFVRLHFHRYGPKDLDVRDNLPAAFKYVVDAVAAWIEWGVHTSNKQIGRADDKLIKRGVTWEYSQSRNPSNARAHGIQVRLYARPSDEP